MGIEKLSAGQRYRCLLRSISSCNGVWGLYHSGGWAISLSKEGEEAFLIWPEKRYAEKYANILNLSYSSTFIPISYFLNVLVKKIIEAREKIGIFPLIVESERGRTTKALIIDAEDLIQDLEDGEF